MAKNPTNNQANDFNAESLVRNIEVHNKDIDDLKLRLVLLENKFGDHIKIATTLRETSKTCKEMDDMLTASLLELLLKNESVKNSITSIVDRSDRNWFYASLKKMGLILWSISFILIGALINRLAGHLF